MRLFTVGDTEITLHPLVLVAVAGGAVLGLINTMLQVALALMLHELSHALVARVFGCRILSVGIMPFGGVIRLSRMRLTPYGELCIAAAGPVTSLVLAGLAGASLYLFPVTSELTEAFLRFNVTLALVNLLPALPLDGGRIMKCILAKRMSSEQAARVAALAGVIIALGMLAVAAILAAARRYHLTLPVMGGFLLLAAVMELRSAPEMRMQTHLNTADGIRNGNAVEVRMLAAHASMPLREALRLIRGGSILTLKVVDGQMRFLGELDEGTLILGLAQSGPDTPVKALLQDLNQDI